MVGLIYLVLTLGPIIHPQEPSWIYDMSKYISTSQQIKKLEEKLHELYHFPPRKKKEKK